MENSNSRYDRNDEGDNPLDDPNIKKDLVLGKSSLELNEVSGDHFVDGGFLLIEGDVKKSVANGIPFIDFSEREHQLLVKEMSTSVVLKLLGRNIGFVALQDILYGIWRPSKPFQLMDIENVQPWTVDFDSASPYPNTILTWIRFPRLPSYLYKNEVLWEIRGMVSKVTKLDFNIDSKVRVRYACMAVYVNLGKPLISKVLINGNLQRVEYESLLVVCFFCGRYGHNNESCPHTSLPSGLSKVRKPKYKNQLKRQKNSGCIAGLDHSVNLLAKPVTGKGYDIRPFSVLSIKDLIGMNSSNPTGEDCVSLDNVAKAHQPSISGGMDPTEEDRVSLDNVAKAYQPFVSGKPVPLSSSSIVLADFYTGGVDIHGSLKIK
ncbi:hypothetical protein Gohar_015647 [Gossypium harknessii]|uniref:CCHC-type domain-containing protein n=1 Tax=Gossypium harknessii TaxID=34285 RepID=A0A7J9G2L5_9ROSI|nr:hypothetical protein [Gossypium harknessii]